ncbi:MAG TPA: LpqB family beta-propeller domain-containing protein, partial [Dermatophilaceae bacterium]|nr:LpqB family beta-propeller domain-containing protein [Dermatophilaceae bacterium]
VTVGVSPDATRVVVVSRGPADGDRVDIAGIIRDPSGRPVSLATPMREAEAIRSVVDATWIDELTVAVAGATVADPAPRPYLVEVGQGIGLRRRGTVDPQDNLAPSAPGVRWLVSTGGPRGILVVTNSGGVLVRVGGAWRTLTGASEVVVPLIG